MKNNKGITMISLVITIIVLLILSSIVIYNSKYQLRMKYLYNLYADIEAINSKVTDYYLKNDTLPVFETAYLDSKDNLEQMLSTISNNQENVGINVNDSGKYYVINLSKLDNLTLNYGMDYKNWTDTSTNMDFQDLYIINEVTHQVYYPYGIKLGDEYYFSRNADENEISSIVFEDVEEDITINIVKKDYTTIDDNKESITANVEILLGEQYKKDSLRYAWADASSEENLNWTKFLLDAENKARISSLPLNKSVISHYLFIEVTDNNGKRVKNTIEIKKEIYAILYSNNADNTDLELVFNSTGELDDSGRTAILQTENIILKHYSSNSNREWNDYCDKIKTVTFKGKIVPQSTANWFNNCKGLTQINTIENLDTSNVRDMSGMFNNCSVLTNLNLSTIQTSNVTDMRAMFRNCSGLTSLDISQIDTGNVKNMQQMFYGCKSLTNIDLEKFETKNVENMLSMFYGCSAITNLDLSSFDTSSVTSMSNMFDGCKELKIIYAGDNWNVAKVTSSEKMFNACIKLVGDISYNASYVDKTYATTTGGYLTYKASITTP